MANHGVNGFPQFIIEAECDQAPNHRACIALVKHKVANAALDALLG
jgi:hypothetical protein